MAPPPLVSSHGRHESWSMSPPWLMLRSPQYPIDSTSARIVLLELLCVVCTQARLKQCILATFASRTSLCCRRRANRQGFLLVVAAQQMEHGSPLPVSATVHWSH